MNTRVPNGFPLNDLQSNTTRQDELLKGYEITSGWGATISLLKVTSHLMDM